MLAQKHIKACKLRSHDVTIFSGDDMVSSVLNLQILAFLWLALIQIQHMKCMSIGFKSGQWHSQSEFLELFQLFWGIWLNFSFKIQIQNSDSEFRFRIQIQNSDSEFRFRIQNSDSEFILLLLSANTPSVKKSEQVPVAAVND